MDEGFVDLRYGAERDASGASFWPSFTDIMMVVLMIFMIASTILMLRNWELVRELRETLAAEREAEALALSATQTSATLEERLAQAQHEISELRIQLLRADEESSAVNAKLARSRQRLLELETDRQGLAARLQQALSDVRLGEDRLQEARTENSRLVRAHASAQERLQESVAELRRLEQSRTDELALLRQQGAEADLQLAELRDSYDELSTKYNKLIKPARTAAGKYLVSVRYRREDGIYLVEFKESEDSDYEFVSREQLESRLSDLKAEHPGSLYVKVIIPKDSGLSYNEAWGFTQDILTRYDYYYQDN
jgi:chromosome segregation ATPase